MREFSTPSISKNIIFIFLYYIYYTKNLQPTFPFTYAGYQSNLAEQQIELKDSWGSRKYDAWKMTVTLSFNMLLCLRRNTIFLPRMCIYSTAFAASLPCGRFCSYCSRYYLFSATGRLICPTARLGRLPKTEYSL